VAQVVLGPPVEKADQVRGCEQKDKAHADDGRGDDDDEY
jgi:hypothetical protein